MKIKVDGKEMDINAAMEKYGTDEESFNKLIEASKPKKMEDLAEEQLGTLKTIEGIIASMSGRVPRGLASTKIATEADNATRLVGKAVSTSAESFSSKKIGGVVGDVSETFITSINNGETAFTAFATAANTISTFLNENFTISIDNASKEINKLGNSGNSLLDFMDTMIKKAGGALEKHENLTTPGSPPANTKIKVNDFVIETLDTDKFVMGGGTNPMGNNSEGTTKTMSGPIDINLNIKVDAPGMDTSQLMLAFNDPTVKQEMILAVGTAANMRGIGESNSYTESRKQNTT
jgi:hypothetical protein